MRTIPSAVSGKPGGVLSVAEHATDRVAAVANIQIKQEFTMPRKELRKEVERLAEAMQEQFQLDCSWRSRDCLDFQRSGAKGQIEIGKNEIELTARLGMLMSAFKGPIESEIRQFISKHIY